MKRRVAAFGAVLAAALLLVGQSEPARAQGRSLFGAEGRPLTAGRVFEIASADLDADGHPDIVVSDFLAPARVLFNDARQAFSKVLTLTDSTETASEGHGVAVADFNGDKTPDLFLSLYGNPSRLLFGDGRGGFTDSGLRHRRARAERRVGRGGRRGWRRRHRRADLLLPAAGPDLPERRPGRVQRGAVLRGQRRSRRRRRRR